MVCARRGYAAAGAVFFVEGAFVTLAARLPIERGGHRIRDLADMERGKCSAGMPLPAGGGAKRRFCGSRQSAPAF